MTSKPVLFLAFANDEARSLRNLAKEAHQLQELLDAKLVSAKSGSDFEVVVRQNVGLKQILDLFQDERYRNRVALFHYGGHATSYELLLENAEGTQAVDAVWFARFLAQQRGLSLVFLNACSTEDHTAALIEAGVGCVVATSQDIPDDVASEFALRFYTGLVGNASIQTASSEAVSAIAATQGEQAATWWQLHPNPAQPSAADWKLHDSVSDWLFGLPALPTLDLPDEPYRYLSWYGREQAELFFGRAKEIRTLFDTISETDTAPIVLLYGQSGVGKSSLLAAGLLPRLDQVHTVRYVRRDGKRGLVAALVEAIGEKGETGKQEDKEIAGLREWWIATETSTGKPLTVIIDQVEEVFTQGKGGVTDEMAQFLAALKAIFAKKELRPQGKLVLGFRKEWYPELKDLLKDQRLPHAEEFLKPLARQSVIEVVLGPARSARLQKQYGLHIDELLPSVVADDLLEDHQSPVAPTLQTLLSKLWRRAKEQSSSKPQFSLDLYQSLKREGILLGDFLDQQLQELRAWQSSAVDSGLQLDLLAAHTSERGTAAQRTLAELLTLYAGEQAGVPFAELVQQNRDKRLLVDPSGDSSADTTHSTRLVHDTLAPLVRERHEKSDKPGQRARRILENRAVDWHNGAIGAVLDEADLKIVEAGQAGMRVWESDEVRLIEASRQARAARQRSRQQVRYAAIAAIAAVVLFAMLAAWQWRQSQQRGDTISAQATSSAQQGATVVALATQSEAQNAQLQVQATAEAELRQTANQRLDQALINQSKRLANLSLQQLTIDPVASVHLALAALPSAENPRPYVAEAEFALAQAVQQVQETAFLSATLTDPSAQVAIGKDSNGVDKIALGGFGGLRVMNLDLSTIKWMDDVEIRGTATVDYNGYVSQINGEYVSFVKWSAKGELLAVVGSKIYVWHGDEQIANYDFGSERTILCADWNPKRSEIMLCAGDSAYFWSPQQADPPQVAIEAIFDQSSFGKRELHWSPDGSWLVAVGNGVGLWDDQRQRMTFKDTYDTYWRFYDWSPDSGQFVTSSYLEDAVRLWSVDDPQNAVSIEHKENPGALFVQITNTVQLLTSASDGKFLLWDRSGQPNGEVESSLGWRLRQGLPPPESKGRVTLTIMPNEVRIRDVSSGAVETTLTLSSSPGVVRWHPTQSRYLAIAETSSVGIWDLEFSSMVMRLLGVPVSGVESLVWVDEQHLLAVTNTGLHIWQVFDVNGAPTCISNDENAQCTTYAPLVSAIEHGNTRLARFIDANTIVYLWNNSAAQTELAPGGTRRDTVELLGDDERLWMVRWNPDGRQLLRFADQGNGELWQLGPQRWSKIGEIEGGFSNATVWLPAGIVEAPGEGRLFDPQTGTSINLPIEGTLFRAQQLTAELLYLVDSAGVLLWNVKTQQTVQRFTVTEQISNGVITLNDKSLMISSASGVSMWEIASGKEQWRFPINTFEVGDSSLSFDGRFASVVSSEGLAIWDAGAEGELLRTATWRDASVSYLRVVWSKVDYRFLSEAESGTTIWRWNPATNNAEQIDDIPYLICIDQCDVDNQFVNVDFSQLLTNDFDSRLRSWHLWRTPDELIAAAKGCCLPRPLSEKQKTEFGLE